MDLGRARTRLLEVLGIIDSWGDLYDRRWGRRQYSVEQPGLRAELAEREDEVRGRVRLARDIVSAMGEQELAELVDEYEEGLYGGHPYTRARNAIVEAIAVLSDREELNEIVGPLGPRLDASHMHPVIWTAAARLLGRRLPSVRRPDSSVGAGRPASGDGRLRDRWRVTRSAVLSLRA